MDGARRRTLALIEATVGVLSLRDRGRQLMLVARDFVDDDDLVEATRVLRSVDIAFYDDLPTYAAADEDLRLAIASFIEALGMDWILLAQPASASS